MSSSRLRILIYTLLYCFDNFLYIHIKYVYIYKFEYNRYNIRNVHQ